MHAVLLAEQLLRQHRLLVKGQQRRLQRAAQRRRHHQLDRRLGAALAQRQRLLAPELSQRRVEGGVGVVRAVGPRGVAAAGLAALAAALGRAALGGQRVVLRLAVPHKVHGLEGPLQRKARVGLTEVWLSGAVWWGRGVGP